MALFVLTLAGWALLTDDPLGGEPVAVAATNLSPSGKPDRTQGASHAPPKVESTTPLAAAAATKTVTIIDGSTGKRQEMPISTARDARAPVEERLLESSRHGALQRIAPDGARPSEISARAVRPLPNKKDASLASVPR